MTPHAQALALLEGLVEQLGIAYCKRNCVNITCRECGDRHCVATIEQRGFFNSWIAARNAAEPVVAAVAALVENVAARQPWEAERAALLRRIEELEADCRSVVNLAVKTKLGNACPHCGHRHPPDGGCI